MGGVLTVVSIIVSIIVFNSVLAATNEIVSDSKSPSATHSQTQSTADPDEDIDEDIDNDIDDIGDQLTDGSITLEEALKNPTVKSELEKQIQGLPDGMKGSVSAEGNTLILTFDLHSSLAEYLIRWPRASIRWANPRPRSSMRTAATPTRCAL